MTPQERKVFELALEALEEAWYHVGTFQPTEKAIDLYDEARTAIKEALAQPEQEPVALKPCWYESKQEKMCRKCGQVHAEAISPPQRTWVGLTDEEIKEGESKEEQGYGFIQGALWAEATLKEKNHG